MNIRFLLFQGSAGFGRQAIVRPTNVPSAESIPKSIVFIEFQIGLGCHQICFWSKVDFQNLC